MLVQTTTSTLGNSHVSASPISTGRWGAMLMTCNMTYLRFRLEKGSKSIHWKTNQPCSCSVLSPVALGHTRDGRCHGYHFRHDFSISVNLFFLVLILPRLRRQKTSPKFWVVVVCSYLLNAARWRIALWASCVLHVKNQQLDQCISWIYASR